MTKSKFDYKKIIERAKNRSIREEQNIGIHFSEWINFDEHNNAIVRKKVYNNNQVSYEIYENEYDELGNITISSHTNVYNNQIYAYECKTYYEYIYNEDNQVIQRKTFNHEHVAYALIKNQYLENRLIKTEEYKTHGLYAPAFVETEMFDFHEPIKIHTYDYGDDGRLIQEKVSLHSGDVSYYIDYDDSNGSGKIVNPFYSGYSWTIASINKGCFEVLLKEDSFSCEILTNIVESIYNHYDDCHWILIGLSSTMRYAYDENKMYNLIQMYKKELNISVDYFY